ncbi:uncharacterized protein EURHEDRAFT_516582 [Aspergillus ruber CBS 135680]|uniref:Deoxyribonuclease NucA/NucB domain-containing protein n=1 Tax=Aspergillus ruber (strain CBS 135680) TaxID=1388766 RepID=A0A017SBQ9_ASPRC|nr:uncharacterized protein EURHEDRAFT_516582 [Aspergillus ruber CBS 135680]EYE93635.1 hypothetical protein EURHEDRAFT_516582 [Aspergillus ruber CBS 135680]
MKFFSIFSIFFLVSSVTAANFAWDCTKSLGTCQNYCYAAKCGRMGRRRFTYDSNANARPGRRKASGCKRNPCNDKKLKFGKFGNSCDEFPFASVKEGGRNAHLRCVNINENRSEGGQLSGFYKKIKNGDKFGITIKNYRRASYCAAKPKCRNDGGQFKLKNGKFAPSRQGLNSTEEFDLDNEDYFVLDEAINGEEMEPLPLRQVETDDGEIHLIIADDLDDPISVGHEIWSESANGTVRVVREIFE